MPSVSLVILRIETDHGFPCVESFDYGAANYNNRIIPSEQKNFEQHAEAIDDEIRTINSGRRKYREIIVETYKMEEEESYNEEEPPPSPANITELTNKGASPESSLSLSQCRKKTSSVSFFSGNPMVESTHGILHLYKHNQLTALDDTSPRSEMIAMISVPAKLTCLDLQQFIAPAKGDIQHMQIIRDNSPNQYMVLVKFRGQEGADRFYKEFNGKCYNSLEEEVAQLVYVAKLESVKSSEGGYLPVSGLTELPTCPVCLERMDESVEGILTILCNHSFHSDCLVQWSDLRCPVCRYLQTPEPEEEHTCSECESRESLWICLICGHIGCGRYQGQHAYRHFQQTSHTFSMHLGNQRVWDYAGDNYVHRLVQTKGEGKLVSFDRNSEFTDDEKLDSLTLEYTYLLTSQLESQRLYFEEKMSFLEKEAMDRVTSLEETVKKTVFNHDILEQKFQECDKERRNYERKYTQVLGRVGKLANELKEEKQINTCLLKNQELWREQVEEKNKEIQGLQEQVSDLIRHLETKAAVSNASEATQKEIEEGQIFMEQAQSPSKSPRQRGKTKKR